MAVYHKILQSDLKKYSSGLTFFKGIPQQNNDLF